MNRIFCFDLDNTLYLPQKRILELVDNNIKRFIYEKFKYNSDEIYELRKGYDEKYGSTLMGLIKEKYIDPLEYLKYIHDIDSRYLPEYDQKLRSMLEKLDGKIILITNSYKEYAIRLLKHIGIYDLFDNIFDIVDMDYFYKSYPGSYLKVLKKINVTPDKCIMFDDSWRQLSSAKNIGMTTVLVGKHIYKSNADFNIENIYKLPDILEKLEIKKEVIS
ncbi:MAG: pyrimidine 5'-nucleotidase [Clostridium sp.]|nr:pyrimidine 5'-nucleotidase [Clostridium sp.]